MPGGTVGQPLKFKTVEELQDKIDTYFSDCDEKGKPYTITGLALALDTSRETLLNYEKKAEYFDTIKRAKLKCQNYAEEFLYTGKNATGAIFNLKNNYGWVDRSEQDVRVEAVKPLLGGETKIYIEGETSNKSLLDTIDDIQTDDSEGS